MIYRIVPFNRGNNKATFDFWDFIGDWMDASRLRSPKKWQNKKAHFWFTEKGWKEIGRPMREALGSAGFQYRILHKKNPKASDVAWFDAYQVALLGQEKR